MKYVIVRITVACGTFSVGEYFVFKSDNFGFCLAFGVNSIFLLGV